MGKENNMKKADGNKRAGNYSVPDCWKIVNLVTSFKHIVENKKTDATTWQEKNSAWQEIANKFNSETTMPRTGEQLRSKFDSLKKDTRKYVTKMREVLTRTGGGPYEEIPPNLLYEKIKELIKLSTEGMESQFDNDGFEEINEDAPTDLPEIIIVQDSENMFYVEESVEEGSQFMYPLLAQTSTPQHDENKMTLMVEVSTPGPSSCSSDKISSKRKVSSTNSWRSYSPAMLKKARHPNLMAAIKSSSENGSFGDEGPQPVEDNSTPPESGKSSNKNVSTEAKDNKLTSKVTPAAPWVARRRPSISQPRISMSGNGQRLGSWADARKKVAETQTELLTQEAKAREGRQNELHKQLIQINKLKILKLKLDTKIKNKALGNCHCTDIEESGSDSDTKKTSE